MDRRTCVRSFPRGASDEANKRLRFRQGGVRLTEPPRRADIKPPFIALQLVLLGSVAQVSSVDIHALQQLLTNMSTGMRIALYTTLTGLTSGMLLGFQYRLLDQAVDRLMAEIIELSEVHITAQLRQLTAA